MEMVFNESEENMGWFDWVFKKDVIQIFKSIIIKAVKLFLGKVVGEVYGIVHEEVIKAEGTGQSGWNKWEIAYKGIKKRVKSVDVPEYLLSILIEVAVSELKPDKLLAIKQD